MRRKFKRERGPRNWRECFWASLNETWDESWRRHAVKRKEFWPAHMLIENYPAERGNVQKREDRQEYNHGEVGEALVMA